MTNAETSSDIVINPKNYAAKGVEMEIDRNIRTYVAVWQNGGIRYNLGALYTFVLNNCLNKSASCSSII